MPVLVKEKNIPPIPRGMKKNIKTLISKLRPQSEIPDIIFTSPSDNMPVSKKISYLKKEIADYTKIVKKFEKEFNIPSEKIIEMEPMEFKDWKAIDEWVLKYRGLQNLKRKLSLLESK